MVLSVLSPLELRYVFAGLASGEILILEPVTSTAACTVCVAVKEPITAPASAVNFTIFFDLVLPFACPSSETAVHVWVA